MSTLSIAPAFVPAARPAARRSTVRLTRRGRLVVFLTSLLLVLGAVFVFAGGAVGTSEKGEAPATVVVKVGPGDTLWGIADEAAGDGSTRDMVSQIRRMNSLDSAALAAGQKLRVPAAG